MATPATGSTAAGTITLVVGNVRVVGVDGVARVAKVGDKVFAREVIETGSDGIIQVQLEGGRFLDVGRDSKFALSQEILAEAGTGGAPETPAAPATPASAEQDAAAIQKLIAAGADPAQVAAATAAGGAPAAGGGAEGGGGTPVLIDQSSSTGEVTSGFPTQPAGITFPEIEPELLPEVEGPAVSVIVQPKPEDGVTVSGNAASVVEGTSDTGATKTVNFVITLSEAFDTDVEVTYVVQPGTALTPEDFGGVLTATVIIPAGETEFIVPVSIVQDHFVESDQNFTIVLTDAVNATIDPAASSAVVTIINDDTAPTANPDTNWTREDTAVTAEGNVLEDNPHAGAPSGSFEDDADVDLDGHDALTVIAVEGAAGNVGGALVGQYGTLVLNADGTYTYTLNNGAPAIQHLDSNETLSESFSYTITDGFNDPSSSTLTVTIFGRNDAPEIVVKTDGIYAEAADAVVDEEGLATGSNAASDAEFTSGSFKVSDTDGVDDLESVTINGQIILLADLVGSTIEGEHGVMTITSFSGGVANFTYELTERTDDVAGQETDVFTLTVTDGTATSDPATVTINIIDDVPMAVDDSNSMTEDDVSVSGNVRANDTQGADRVATVTPGSFEGDFGTLVLNANGTYTYTLTADLQHLEAGQSVEEHFPYVLTDVDGDPSNAVLTITITGANDNEPPTVGAATTRVSEEGLEGGIPDTGPNATLDQTDSTTADSSQPAGPNNVHSGSIAIADPDGDGLTVTLGIPSTTLFSGGEEIEWSLSNGGQMLTGSIGSGEGEQSIIEVTINNSGDYTVTLLGPVDHDLGDDIEGNESFTVVVTASDGEFSDTGDLVVSIEDDSPVVEVVVEQREEQIFVPTLTTDDTDIADAASAGFAGMFDSDFGADGPGAVTYSLNAVSGDSGLVDSLSGEDVVLSMSGGVVEGRTESGGDLVFTVSVDGDGVVTLTQLRSVIHDDPNDPDENTSPATLSSANLVTLTATITDADDDSDAATLDIGHALAFEDDGPDINAVSASMPTLTTDDTDITDAVSESFAGMFTVAHNSTDGDNTVSYELNAVSGDSGLVDTVSGEDVVLSLNATTGVVEGHTESGGELVFTVSVDGDGVVTLTQYRSVVHDDPNDPDENTSPATLSAANLVTLTATITDADNDSDKATVDIGHAFSFEDDGPDINQSSASMPTLTTDDTAITDAASASFAGMFTTAHESTDEDNTISYELNAVSGDSGLVDTLSGEDVVLSLNATTGMVEGHTESGGDLVFTVSVDGDGMVTLTQYRSVVHDDPNDPSEDGAGEPSMLSAANLVTLTATITDADGDSDKATVDIGHALAFEDDGPDINAVSASMPTLTTDDTDITDAVSESFAGMFTVAHNSTDGDNTVSYELNAVSGDSGLVDTVSGEDVVLSLNATTGMVEGHTESGGELVFTVSVDGDGVVTLTQYRSVVHDDPNDPSEDGAGEPSTLSAADLVTLTATITDGDGDTDVATANIGHALAFEDDGPDINQSSASMPTLTVDETVLATDASASFAGMFTTAHESTDQENTVTYSLNAVSGDSGLVDTLSGEDVVLSMSGGVVEGRTESGGDLVFTVSVDGDGVVTLNQLRSVVHDDPNDPDEAASPATLSAANLVTLTATITDADNDSDKATVNIGDALAFEDDGPKLLTPDDISVENTGAAGTADLRTANLNFLPGEDAVGNVVFDVEGVPVGVTSGETVAATDDDGNLLKVGGEQLYLYYGGVDGTDTTILIAKTLTGVVGYTLDIDAATGQYTFNPEAMVSNGTQISATDLTGVGGGNKPFKMLVDIGGSTEDVAITTASTTTINTDNDDISVGTGQTINGTEALRFDLVNGLQGVPDNSNPASFTYDGTHNDTTRWTQKVLLTPHSNTADFSVTAILADSDTTFYGNGTPDAGETVRNLTAADIRIYDDTETLVANPAGAGIVIDDSPTNSVNILNLPDGWWYEIVVDDDRAFNAIQIAGLPSTDNFALGFFKYGVDFEGTSIDLNYDIVGTDGDGDPVNGSIDVSIYPDGTSSTGSNLPGTDGNDILIGTEGGDTLGGASGTAGNDIVVGNTGNDILRGGNDDDILIGGGGNDQLFGGGGNDVLRGESGNDVLMGGEGEDTYVFQDLAGTDTVLGFEAGPGADVLDISEILQGAGINPDDVTDSSAHLILSNDGVNTTLSIDLQTGMGPVALVTITGQVIDNLTDLLNNNIVKE